MRRLPWLTFSTLLGLILVALLAPWIAPHPPLEGDLLRQHLPPAWLPGSDPRFLLGTDEQGRDILSNILFGLRVSLSVGFFAVLLSVLIGVPLGLLAGYRQGIGELVMRAVDVQLAIPTFLIALVVLALWGAGLFKLILVIGVVGWAEYARLVRGAVLAEREREYVLAAEALGVPTPRVLFRHILPNVLSVVLVQVSVDAPRVTQLEATLSFLGVGVSIETPSIGLMVKRGMDYLFSGIWWTTVLPGLALMLLVLTTNLLGDWLRDAFDPRRRQVRT